jgi:hypothetical protein
MPVKKDTLILAAAYLTIAENLLSTPRPDDAVPNNKVESEETFKAFKRHLQRLRKLKE